MTAHPRPPDNGTSDGDSNSGFPRWLYLVGIVAAILILIFVALHLAAGSLDNHGPGRHFAR